MAIRFDFDASYPSTATYLERADLTTGSYPGYVGLDYPTWYSAVSPYQSISTYGGVDVFAVTLLQGQTYAFDIDSAALNLEIDIINQAGQRVAGNDTPNDFNAFLEWAPSQTGIYYVAIHHADNDYTGNFDWQRDTSQTGSYRFSFSADPNSAYQPAASRTYNLSDASQSLRFYDAAEEVRGNGGNDYLLLQGGNDIGLGGSGSDTIYGELGMDELSGGSGNDRLYGGANDDVLRGGYDNDRLYGGDGRDGLLGGTGNDILYGEAGNDTISGESGSDVIRGGTGLDILFGGTGADVFRFDNGEAPASIYSVEDRIEDFSRSQGDLIDLRYAYGDADSGLLTWRGTSAFTGAYQVRVVELDSGYTDVRVNLDSDSTAEIEVLVRMNFADLYRTDFLL